MSKMESRFRLKLTLTMIFFAMVISVTLAITDHIRLKHQAEENKNNLMLQNEELVLLSFETIEKAYFIFGEHIAANMKEASLALIKLYEEHPSFDQWNFQELKNMLAYDIYIINSDNIITHSSMELDIGLDFKDCCTGLAKTLEERRSTGQFYHDGIDIEQKTGILKKYSYIATPDQKYIIQLGYDLQRGDIFQQFNFFGTIDELLDKNASINEINILNTAGNALGDSANATRLSGKQYEAFRHTLNAQETTELEDTWNGEKAIFRYIPYSSRYDIGTMTQNKVLQIIYNDRDLQHILDENKQTFIIQLSIILIITIILSFIIARAVSRPMHLAFHDSLTGLKNRAAFDETMLRMLNARNQFALLMIDLDNFKLVNDYLGHDKGDRLLKCVADCIQGVARKEDISVRLGGDEFIMIMRDAGKEEAIRAAERIIDAITTSLPSDVLLSKQRATVSIGISFSPEHGVDAETLIKNADKALYLSKEQGKNQYQVYDG